MSLKKFLPALIILTLASCAIPVDEAPPPTPPTTDTPQPTLTLPATFPAIPTLTQSPVLTQTPIPTSAPDFCADIRGYDLIESMIQAFATEDGALFASLISPSRGVDVRYYRNGKVINYDAEHAKFVFETTYQADWGLAPGRGESTIGSFQEIVLPSLQQVFTTGSAIVCSQLQTGPATYFPEWPYPGMDFYSVYFAGTDEFGGLDWQTWGVGMDIIDGSPHLVALVHYFWEP